MDDLVSVHTWWLAQLKPNCMHIAERNLSRQGFRIFCPKEQTTKRHKGRFVTTNSPLFPGYLFVGCAERSAPSRAVNSTYGVSRLVSFSEHAPAEVPLEIISGLLARCDDQCILKAPQVLQKGDTIRITSGPFANFVGTVESLGAQERVWALLDLLGGSTRVAIRQRDVQQM